MYEVRSRDISGKVVAQSESLTVAKQLAEQHKDNSDKHYDIYCVVSVWTTQTLDEASKS